MGYSMNKLGTRTPKRRWLRFSLKSFLLINCIFGVWLGMCVRDALQQRRAVAMVQRLNGKYEYDYEFNAMPQPNVRQAAMRARLAGNAPVVIEAPGPRWLRRLIGDDYFVDLHRVDLIDAQATDADLKLLKNQHSLWCLRLWETQITDEGLRHIQGLRNLSILDLRNADVTDAGMIHVGKLKNLRGLGLGYTKITDAGLAHVARLADLQSLTLSHTKVSDSGMTYLSRLTDLWTLNLEGTAITDTGLVHVSGLRKLKQLELNDTLITDAGLAHLRSMTDLIRLNVNDTFVDEEGVQELFKALPKITEIRRSPIRRSTTIQRQ